MKDIFAQWFAYNGEANKKIIEMAGAKVPQRTKSVLSHLLISHRVWIDRIHGKVPRFKPWDELGISQFAAFNQKALEDTLALLDSCDDLNRQIQYSNTKGQKFTNTIQDILFHLLTHSAYHRGQINQAARQSGIEPVLTDFIFYSRDGDL